MCRRSRSGLRDCVRHFAVVARLCRDVLILTDSGLCVVCSASERVTLSGGNQISPNGVHCVLHFVQCSLHMLNLTHSSSANQRAQKDTL